MQKLIQSLVLTIFCLFSFCGYTQTKYGIVRFHAFVQESAGGNIPVDENGNPMHSGIHTNHFLFAETTGKTLPKFDTVYTNDRVYSVQAVEIKSGKKSIGKLKDAIKSTQLIAKRGNRLWQLVLNETGNTPPKKLQSLLAKNKVVVTGKLKTTKFTLPIQNLKQLETIFLQ
jgi:hypothetical protein